MSIFISSYTCFFSVSFCVYPPPALFTLDFHLRQFTQQQQIFMIRVESSSQLPAAPETNRNYYNASNAQEYNNPTQYNSYFSVYDDEDENADIYRDGKLVCVRFKWGFWLWNHVKRIFFPGHLKLSLFLVGFDRVSIWHIYLWYGWMSFRCEDFCRYWQLFVFFILFSFQFGNNLVMMQNIRRNITTTITTITGIQRNQNIYKLHIGQAL